MILWVILLYCDATPCVNVNTFFFFFWYVQRIKCVGIIIIKLHRDYFLLIAIVYCLPLHSVNYTANIIARITLLRRRRGNEPVMQLLQELCKYMVILRKHDREKVVNNQCDDRDVLL